jgi:hypothetical protein
VVDHCADRRADGRSYNNHSADHRWSTNTIADNRWSTNTSADLRIGSVLGLRRHPFRV